MSAFIGAGIVSVAPWSESDDFDSLTFRDVGNVSKLSYNFTEDRKELKNYRTAAGGTYASVARIDKAELAMDFRDFSPENMSMALWGETASAAGAATVEAMIAQAPLMAVKFDGINLVDGKKVVGKFFKCRLGAPQGVDMIGEDFATLSITGTLEADTDNITTAGKSQYFKLEFTN